MAADGVEMGVDRALSFELSRCDTLRDVARAQPAWRFVTHLDCALSLAPVSRQIPDPAFRD
jgi:hypothetical protein